MQIKNIIISLILSVAVAQAQTVAGEPRCDDGLETYDGCIADSSIYQQEAATGNPPDRFSRTTQCYYCFQGAESTCGDQYGDNPDTLSDDGKACYNTNMQECQESRGQQCKWFLRGQKST